MGTGGTSVPGITTSASAAARCSLPPPQIWALGLKKVSHRWPRGTKAAYKSAGLKLPSFLDSGDGVLLWQSYDYLTLLFVNVCGVRISYDARFLARCFRSSSMCLKWNTSETQPLLPEL